MFGRATINRKLINVNGEKRLSIETVIVTFTRERPEKGIGLRREREVVITTASECDVGACSRPRER